MRRMLLRAASALGLGWALNGASARAEAARNIPREVLAFYYGWYGTPETSGSYRHWVLAPDHHISSAAHQPIGGPYDSLDPGKVTAQVALAKQAGVTGFIASWWGQHSFEDASVAPLLEAAEPLGLRVTAYLEKIEGADLAARIDNVIADLRYILRVHAPHPAWLRVGGKPVIFIYSRAGGALPLATWRIVLSRVRQAEPGGLVAIAPNTEPAWIDVFDGGHDYNTTGQIHALSEPDIRAWTLAHTRETIARAGPKIACATLIPGYDDSATDRPPPRPNTARDDGKAYAVQWEAAIAAAPDWILLTSWNEWHEGTEIEPSVETAQVYITETASYSREFLHPPARSL
jgi:hypothetical protein